MGGAGFPRLPPQQGARQSLTSGLGGLRRWIGIYHKIPHARRIYAAAKVLPRLWILPKSSSDIYPTAGAAAGEFAAAPW